MTPTIHLRILEALQTRLDDALLQHVTREEVLPQECPPDGLVNLVPQAWQEVERIISPPIRVLERPVELQIVVNGEDAATRARRLDLALAHLSAALTGETLGGLVDFVDLEAPAEIEAVPMNGAETLTGAIIVARLHYLASENQMESPL